MNEKTGLVLLAALLGLSLALPANAQPNVGVKAAGAGLLVAPTRVTFDNRHRTAALTVVNNGNEAATYRISFIQMKMDETGQIREMTPAEAAVNPASELVRFSPRQVYLEPHASQTVRLQVRKPENLADGEYRSHLLLRVLPNEDSSGKARAGEKPEAGLSVQLTMLYGVSIPIIVRQGELWSKVALQPLTYVPPQRKDEAPVLVVQMNRTGNESAYGDLSATLVEKNGRETRVGTIKGLAVYSPNPMRTVRMTLTPPPGVDLKSGRIRISYAKPDQKTDLLASGYLNLP
jgi:P pilus assembly chaperone PapD